MDADWHREQIDQAAETFRFLVGLVVGVWSFIIGADAALFVYGATVGSPVALYTAAALPLVCLAAWLGVSRSLVTLAFVAIRSELAVGAGELGIVQTYGRTVMPQLEAELRRLAELDPPAAQAALNRTSRGRPVGRGIVVFLIAVSLVQLLAAVLLTATAVP